VAPLVFACSERDAPPFAERNATSHDKAGTPSRTNFEREASVITTYGEAQCEGDNEMQIRENL
jgi:hypothetical protein